MRSLTNFAPSTFEERGAAVGFTTPTLAQTRVRQDERGNLEVLIPNISEGRGVYVVAWKSLPLAFPMTVHDRCLQDILMKSGGCSPDDLRKATLETARFGLAGPNAADAAEAAMRDDEEQRLLINYQLITEVLKAVGLDAGQILKAGLGSAQGEKLTRDSMTRAAKSLGIDATELYTRVAELALFMEPVGLPTSPKPARLRRMAKELQKFHDTMTEWSTTTKSEAGPIGGFCAEVAEHTLNHVRHVVTRLDQSVSAFELLLRQWEAKRKEVKAACTRLSWLLDGWDYITALWADAHGRSRHEQDMAVHDIFRIIPLLPRDEGRIDFSLEAGKVLTANRKIVRAYVDWRTGQLDADLVQRIEQLKTRAA
ncbi:hypothetical protein HL658_28165 [Azospirillum sp. RWY-5-1]|uniref:Uncharacterized protein n=1 Tax=Azospirillum oleiclasticum TaxID=2735135 RepID=A0ABX2THW8_9PROT|nr:hypothetical protein [Azospirillum oleiclasticum]NYZ16436.1 hypothetical protein [Azospirillum oleiclasticum]NYZ23848.1 hypothetical protein [Azospirillum oleiclasticum]